MNSPRQRSSDAPAAPEISLGTLLWVAASALFVLLRLAYVVNAPVGGFELIHLSGAWQASVGESDTRFVPTLFQAVTSLALRLIASETPARVLAFLATSTVPAAVYLLRSRLGEAGALLALVFLALDGPAIAVGSSASALGFDTAIALWLFWALVEGPRPAWVWCVLAFAAASAGPLVLPLAIGGVACCLLRRRYPARDVAVAGAIGATAAVALASFGFGWGWQGITAPPFVLFAASFDQAWSAATTLQLVAVYSAPWLAVGLASVATAAYRVYRTRSAATETVLLLTWALLATGWAVTSLNSHNPVALAGLTLPLALISGPMVASACVAVWKADWRIARFLVPAALFAFLLAFAFLMDWARLGKSRDINEQLLVAGFVILGISCLGYVASVRVALPALFVPAGVVLFVPMLAGAFGTAFGSTLEQLPAPVSPRQTRDLRDIALATAESSGGRIVVHPSLVNDITWGFRDSGTLVVASRVPETAAVVLWPVAMPRPDGYSPLAGDWLARQIPPTVAVEPLDYLRWFMHRNSGTARPVRMAVYVKDAE